MIGSETMKHFLVTLTILALILAACATDSEETSTDSSDDENVDAVADVTETAPAIPTETPTPENTDEEAPTPQTSPSPTAAPEDELEEGSEELTALIVEPEDDISSWTYDPEEITANAGDAIVWTNDGDAAHTVTSVEGSSFEFDSDSIASGGTFSLEVPDAGEYEYFCTFHPWMEGTIVVEE